jgi:putative ABC transport system permease protein
LNNNLETTTPYDASFVSFYETAGALDGTAPAETAPSAHEKAAAADDYDMHAALSRDIPQYDDLVKQDAQIDFYYGPVKFGQMMATTKYDFGSSYDLATLQERPVSLVSLSQYNAIRALVGAEPVELADDECLLWCDFSTVQSFFEAFLKQNDTLDVDGTPMRLSSEGLQTFASQTSSFALNAGTLILPDAAMPADKVRADSCLNVMYTGSREETSAPFVAAVDAAYGSGSSASSSQDRWPFNGLMTAQQAYIQSVGTSTIIAYLAIYIGFVLLIACAAILALQQLTEASDNVSRYRLLEEIGAEQHMVNKALFIQIGIYFIFPMIVAICHSVVALLVVADVVEVFGGIQILQPLLVTVTLFIAVYGGYFLVTYFASRALIRPRLRSR